MALKKAVALSFSHHPFVSLTRDTESTERDIFFDLARDAAKSKSSAPLCGAGLEWITYYLNRLTDHGVGSGSDIQNEN